MNIDDVREIAMALPGVSEEPHHHFASFRVDGRIFITVPPDNDRIHLFLPEALRDSTLAANPDFTEKLWWGKKVAGMVFSLGGDASRLALAEELIKEAWAFKQAKKARPRKN